MKLVDFLILLLEAHSQTLHRLAAMFGDDLLVQILEHSEGSPSDEPEVSRLKIQSIWFEKPKSDSGSNPYQELEGAVREFKLPALLEFHLWAYPHYRAFIESPIDLNSRIQESTSQALVDEAIASAEAWIRKLPIAPEFVKQADSASHVSWIRFRTNVLKKIGKRPLENIKS